MVYLQHIAFQSNQQLSNRPVPPCRRNLGKQMEKETAVEERLDRVRAADALKSHLTQ